MVISFSIGEILILIVISSTAKKQPKYFKSFHIFSHFSNEILLLSIILKIRNLSNSKEVLKTFGYLNNHF